MNCPTLGRHKTFRAQRSELYGYLTGERYPRSIPSLKGPPHTRSWVNSGDESASVLTKF